MTNQHSLSDAEDFTEGYRTLKLGKVVGEPTAGWIIYTGSMDLLDGTVDAHARNAGRRARTAKTWKCIRAPSTSRCRAPSANRYTGSDSQLDVAVKELSDRNREPNK